jgi:hypothetical protein
MSARRFGWAMVVLGIVVTLGAIAWWASFYGDVIKQLGGRGSLRDLVHCLYSSSGDCGVVTGVTQIFGGTPYTPTIFYAGIAALVIGAVVRFSAKD